MYVGGNPETEVDPTGHLAIPWTTIGELGLAGSELGPADIILMGLGLALVGIASLVGAGSDTETLAAPPEAIGYSRNEGGSSSSSWTQAAANAMAATATALATAAAVAAAASAAIATATANTSSIAITTGSGLGVVSGSGFGSGFISGPGSGPSSINLVTGIASAAAATALAFAKKGRSDTYNQVEDRQWRYILQQIARRIGRRLTKAEERRLHDEISKQGFDVEEIIEIGVSMFGDH